MKNLPHKIIENLKQLDPIDISWCENLLVEKERFSNISITVDLNELNYITHININFHTNNPPGYIFTGKIKISDFTTKEELVQLVRKLVKLANINIADAIRRAAQLELFS